jgi:hypothetical protein
MKKNIILVLSAALAVTAVFALPASAVTKPTTKPVATAPVSATTLATNAKDKGFAQSDAISLQGSVGSFLLTWKCLGTGKPTLAFAATKNKATVLTVTMGSKPCKGVAKKSYPSSALKVLNNSKVSGTVGSSTTPVTLPWCITVTNGTQTAIATEGGFQPKAKSCGPTGLAVK